MYLAFSGPQYIRHGLHEPLRALARRICSLNEVVHLPPWMNEWMVHEARRSAVDAAVILVPRSNRLSVSGTRITKLSLEAAGVPALEIDADMVDAQGFQRSALVDTVSEFLVTRVEAKRRKA
jgi:hypothetical protein